MVHLLQVLHREHFACGVKMEFEAEGTRLEEAMRLKEVSMAAGLPLTIKIGGCEALKDIRDAANLGAAVIVAPMVETAYAFKKFAFACESTFRSQRGDTEFFINLETHTAMTSFQEMLALPESSLLDGVVLGRVDLCGSLNMGRDFVNGNEIFALCREAAVLAKTHAKKVLIGGAVTIHSVPFFQAFPPRHLDGFETRKIIFSCPEALENEPLAFLRALEFEILWLKNKREFYGQIYQEDDTRIQMMEARYSEALNMVREYHVQ